MHGDPESTESLTDAKIDHARAIVADVDDESNASIALAVRQAAPSIRILTFVEDVDLAEYHQYAGADQVFTPRHLIGESLAAKVTTAVTGAVADAVEIGEELEIVEIPIQAGSDLAGTTVGESGIRERTGANVIGAWFRGEFDNEPEPDDRIDARTVLLVAGRDEQLAVLQQLARRRPVVSERALSSSVASARLVRLSIAGSSIRTCQIAFGLPPGCVESESRRCPSSRCRPAAMSSRSRSA